MWTEILTALGGSAILIGAIAWLTKSIITHFLSKDVVNFKNQIKAESDKNIEAFKNALQMAAFEHQVRFSKLHEKRADVIAEIYKLIVESNNSIYNVLLPARFEGQPSDEEMIKDATSKLNMCLNSYDINRIYLREESCKIVQKLIDKLRKPYQNYIIYKEQKPFNRDEMKERHAVLFKAWESITNDEFTIVFDVLTNEFRNILGVIEPEKSDN